MRSETRDDRCKTTRRDGWDRICSVVALVARSMASYVAMASQLAPGFIVAAPSLLDPNFRRTVVLMVDHRPEGSFGFVINRPAEASMRAMLERIGLAAGSSKLEDASVLVGGPVAPHTGWVVFEPDQPLDEAAEIVRVSERLAVSASRDLLERLVAQRGAGRLLLVLGHAGWGPGQLDAEIAQGAWIPVDFDDRIVFETPFDERWAGTLRILGIDPARLSLVTPSES
jgi:putative transcriptional regulator